MRQVILRLGFFIVTWMALAFHADAQTVTTVAGGGVGEGSSAHRVDVAFPVGLAMDQQGRLYIASFSDRINSRILRLDPNGIIETVAGNGFCCYSGDSGAATRASLHHAHGVTVAPDGTLYIADTFNHVIRKVARDGTITTIMGTGRAGSGGAGGTALQMELNLPRSLAVGADGDLYIADTGNSRIVKLTPKGTVVIVAGTGAAGYGGDGGHATAAALRNPSAVALGPGGIVYIADTANHRIRQVASDGTITTVAGIGRSEFSGDRGPALRAGLSSPAGLFVDGDGVLYIADTGNHRIRRVAATGIIDTVAGSGLGGIKTDGVVGFGGDDGPATAAHLAYPTAVVVTPDHALFIADRDNRRVRRVSAGGVIRTAAGTGIPCFGGDGGLATQAGLRDPCGIAVDEDGALYIADMSTYRIRKVEPSGIIVTVAGSDTTGFRGDLGPAVDAGLGFPSGVYRAGGELYIADTLNHRVRKVDRAGIITTVAGTGEAGFGGDGEAASAARLDLPFAVAVDAEKNLYIADQGNHRIRRVSLSGVITTIAGAGQAGYGGDGGPAVKAKFWNPSGLALDRAGQLYIADQNNHRIRKIDAAGIVTTVAGTGEAGFSGDGGTAGQAKLFNPMGITFDESGALYIADTSNHRIRMVDARGMISTVAGVGTAGYGGDGGDSLRAHLHSPCGLVAVRDALYVTDKGNNMVRKISSLRKAAKRDTANSPVAAVDTGKVQRAP